MLKKRCDVDNSIIDSLSNELGCSRIQAELLALKGITNVFDCKKFLTPQLNYLSNVFEYSGMQSAVDRIKEAIQQNQKIVVYGDYDCDGICATAIMWQSLLEHNVDCDYFLPDRRENGYGLSNEAVENIAEELFPDLIITVDCGITAIEEVRYIQDELGIDVIVTDHHEPPSEIPNCIAIDPKLDRDKPIFTELCGAGVAFSLIKALWGDYALKYIDLVAIATIGDIVPLIEDNRILTYFGLKEINKNPRPCFNLLAEKFGIKGKITSTDISYRFVPRINSLGRMGDANRAMLLLSSSDTFILKCAIDEMEEENKNRQSECEKVSKEAIKIALKDNIANKRSIVVYNKDWNEGVLGIAAAKVAETFCRPTILLTDSENCIKGSARGIENADIYDALLSCSTHLISFGGHKQAAGVKLEKDSLLAFSNAFDNYFKNLDRNIFDTTYYYDIDITNERITSEYIDDVLSLEPFGYGNTKPIFLLKDSGELAFANLKNANHIKAKSNNGYSILGFNMGAKIDLLNNAIEKNLLVELNLNEYDGKIYPQATLEKIIIDKDIIGVQNNDCIDSYISKSIIPADKNYVPTIIEFDKAISLLQSNDMFGTLLVAFNPVTYYKTLEIIKTKNIFIKSYYKYCEENPYNGIILAPDDENDFAAYNNIVFLDSTPNGFISLFKDKNCCILSDVNNLQLKVNTDRECLVTTFIALKKCILESNINKSATLYQLCKKYVQNQSVEQFYFGFYVFFQLGIIDINSDGYYYINNIKRELSSSKLYQAVLENGII